ncbi:VOC family protein [Micromonospora nigra]|uniref:VOC family protein n=1 Tax=Micromonospora nigra TaxID=145857 RepID=UPI000B836B0E|nr:VOC family protein [Micromonospora nigra]
MSTVPPGTPCWVDLATPGLDEARRFYPELFGWTGRVDPEPEAGGYTVFLLSGRAVAGAGPPAVPDQEPIWSTYVATDDANLVVGRVRRAGGQVVVPPFPVFDRGRMAVFADPAGAAFSVWQPMTFGGTEMSDRPGTMSWTELVTPDPEGAKEFYGLVFGWQPYDERPGPGTYAAWRLGDRVVARMVSPPAGGSPLDGPAYWSVSFAVADADATAARAAEQGGTILVPPRPVPTGRQAVLRDPEGALFAVTTHPTPSRQG